MELKNALLLCTFFLKTDFSLDQLADQCGEMEGQKLLKAVQGVAGHPAFRAAEEIRASFWLGNLSLLFGIKAAVTHLGHPFLEPAKWQKRDL